MVAGFTGAVKVTVITWSNGTLISPSSGTVDKTIGHTPTISSTSSLGTSGQFKNTSAIAKANAGAKCNFLKCIYFSLGIVTGKGPVVK